MAQLAMLAVLTPLDVDRSAVLLVDLLVAPVFLLLIESLLREVPFRDVAVAGRPLIVSDVSLSSEAAASITRILSIVLSLLCTFEDVGVLGLEFNVRLYHVKKSKNLVLFVLVVVDLGERLVVGIGWVLPL